MQMARAITFSLTNAALSFDFFTVSHEQLPYFLDHATRLGVSSLGWNRAQPWWHKEEAQIILARVGEKWGTDLSHVRRCDIRGRWREVA
jgi:hypothetical protein